MKKIAMTNDDFAKFMAKCIFKIDNYQFDTFYDISKIVMEFNKYRGESDKPIMSTYHFMLRSTGSDLIDPMDENYPSYQERSTIIYSLEFCWNRDYFNIPFCYVKKIK